eukprot:356041-Chlamydomonas_euryale.AAC.3
MARRSRGSAAASRRVLPDLGRHAVLPPTTFSRISKKITNGARGSATARSQSWAGTPLSRPAAKHSFCISEKILSARRGSAASAPIDTYGNQPARKRNLSAGRRKWHV